MRAVGERMWPGLAGLVLCFCTLFFAQGLADAPLVWIGGLALVAGAVFLLWPAAPGAAALAYLGCLWGLALWCGLSIVWSVSPDGSWIFTNRSLAYAGFALLGVLIGARSGREHVAAAATVLVSVVLAWALLAKCVPALYSDYGRVARLRAPLADWNMLALVSVAAVPLALWLASRTRLAGALLLYLAVVTVLLTYSRFGVVLALAAAAAWILREDDRVESIVACALAGAVGAGVFGIALALSGITSDGASRSIRARDGGLFALAIVGGAVVVGLAAVVLLRLPPLTAARRRGIERAAAALALLAVVAGIAVTAVNAGTIWHEFTNPVATQTTNKQTHLTQLGAGNRWSWWREAWDGFTAHPLGGTGAGTFRFTDLRLRQSSDITALEPHNTPLQFLSETGIVGFLLFLGAAAAALVAAWRTRGPLGIVVAAFFVHTVVNYDWSFVAVCGPFLLLGGVLVARPAAPVVARRPLLAAAAVAFALACVYSLAAPWLAQRAQASATSAADLKRAHGYDPLSTSVLTEWALFESGDRSIRLFRDALALEPTNPVVWFELAQQYADGGEWVNAYRALSRAYEYDPFGPAGQCGIAATIRAKAGVKGVSCRGGERASSP